MFMVSVTIIGFIGLVTMPTLIQSRKYKSFVGLSALTAAGLLFLALTTFGLYNVVHSQTLQIGTICGSLVILLKNAQLVKLNYTALSTGGAT